MRLYYRLLLVMLLLLLQLHHIKFEHTCIPVVHDTDTLPSCQTILLALLLPESYLHAVIHFRRPHIYFVCEHEIFTATRACLYMPSYMEMFLFSDIYKVSECVHFGVHVSLLLYEDLLFLCHLFNYSTIMLPCQLHVSVSYTRTRSFPISPPVTLLPQTKLPQLGNVYYNE